MKANSSPHLETCSQMMRIKLCGSPRFAQMLAASLPLNVTLLKIRLSLGSIIESSTKTLASFRHHRKRFEEII